jgi:hypothetical protein
MGEYLLSGITESIYEYSITEEEEKIYSGLSSKDYNNVFIKEYMINVINRKYDDIIILLDLIR